jgi:hypothetical protein
MAGKITTVLARKEAEAYSSQGLHYEAVNLYHDLLAGSPNIDPAIKRAIQSRIRGLNEAMAAADTSNDGPLSHEEIVRIRKGWGARATPTDILVCAHAFCQVGSYEDALIEYIDLLKTAGLKKVVVHGVADCLARLHTPGEMAERAARLAGEISAASKPALAMQLTMAKHLAYGEHNAHAIAVFEHLKQHHPTLAALADGYLSKLEAIETPPHRPSSHRSPEGSPARFSLRRLGRLFSRKRAGRIDPEG